MEKEKWYVHEGEGEVSKAYLNCYFCWQNTILEIVKGDWVKHYAYVCDNAECRAKGEFSMSPHGAWKDFKEKGEGLQASINWWESPGPNSLRKKIMEEHGFKHHLEINKMYMRMDMERMERNRIERENSKNKEQQELNATED